MKDRKNRYQKYDKKYMQSDKGKETKKRYAQSEKGKKARQIHDRTYRQSSVKKRIAHTRINNYIHRNYITRDICAICGKENADAHHENYDEPLHIIWLCKEHHRIIHGKGD